MGVMGADGSNADGWTRLPAGAIDKRNKEKDLMAKEIKRGPYGKRKEGFYNNVITCA